MTEIEKGYFPDKATQMEIKQGVDNIATQIENKDAGKVMKSKVFEMPGIYTWAVPEGVTEVFLTGCGGGGSGAHGPQSGGAPENFGACGGGAHFVEYYQVPVTPGQSVPITVGAGGAAVLLGGSNGANGLTGGVTSFGSYLSLSGGGGGNFSTMVGGAAGGPMGTKGGNGVRHGNSASLLSNVEIKGGNCGPFVGGILGSYGNQYPGGDGAPGCGGGGVGINSEGTPSGKGGDGFLIVKWWE